MSSSRYVPARMAGAGGVRRARPAGRVGPMRAVQVSEPGGPLELVERDVPAPAPGEALVRVQACGICHSDSYVKEGGFPGVTYPAVPGHEIAGTVAALGEGVRGWEVGQRVGVGWFGGNCGWGPHG